MELNRNEYDMELTGNPQITYFKNVYRRHTFFMKRLVVALTDSNELNKPIQNLTHKLQSGSMDLISDIYIKHQFTGLQSTDVIYANVGNNLIKNISIKVGGRDLYSIDGLAMELIAELENPYIPIIKDNHICPPELTLNSSLTVNNGNNYNMMCFAGGVSGSNISVSCSSGVFFTRPDFDFCKSYDKSFPICALNNTEVSFVATYNKVSQIGSFKEPATLKRSLIIETIILGNEEKRRIVNNTDNYIFFKVQNVSANSDLSNRGLPIRSIFFAGPINTVSGSWSASLSISTPVKIQASIGITIDGHQMNISSNNITDNIKQLTRENIYKYYGNGGFGGRELSGATASKPLLEKNLGQYDSIGLYTQSLDPNNSINGFIPGNSTTRITIDSIINISVYIESICRYRIIGGQIDGNFA